MEAYLVFSAFLFGLVFGSFYNVVIYRLPRGLSLSKPRSSCPACGHELTPAELIPVLSYLSQRGLCTACLEPIAIRYPLVELVTALGFALIAWHSANLGQLIAGVVFFSFLLILALIDLEHKILPNTLTLPGLVLGLFFAFLGWTLPLPQSLLGALVGFTVIFMLALISRGGMGMGDSKLLALIGAFLGWQKVFFVLFGASFLGSIFGILYLYRTKQDRKTQIPFGPCLAIAAIVVYFWL